MARRAAFLSLLCSLAGCAALASCSPAPAAAEIARPANLVDPLILARVETAIQACERGDPGAWCELAEVYDANDLDELALRTYAAALRQDEHQLGQPSERVRYHHARVLQELGREEEALAELSELASGPARDYAPLHARRGELLFELGRMPEARAAFARALELEPAGVTQRLGLARVQLFVGDAGDAGAARAALDALARELPRERLVHGLLARAASALGDEARAREELELERRANQSTRPDPWSDEVGTRATGIEHEVQRAGEALATDDFEGALTILETLHVAVPDDFAVIEALARACNAARRHARALELLEHGRALYPDRFQLELQAGIAALGLRRLPEARAFLEHALELNPARASIHTAYGEVLLRQELPAEAEQALLAALEHGERDPRARSLLASAQMKQEAWARAGATLEGLCADAPRNPFTWSQLAEVRARQHDLAGARAALRSAEELDPRCSALPGVRELLARAGSGGE